jgi:hypothetical protein
MESSLEPPRDGLAHCARNDDPTRRRLCLKSRGHVYIVAIDVIAFNDDIAEVKADPKHDCLFLGLVVICLNHSLLELNRRSERVHGASELKEAAVARQPDHPPAAAGGSWRKPSIKMFQKARNGTTLIAAHQPRRCNHVCKQDRGQPSLLSGQRHTSRSRSDEW